MSASKEAQHFTDVSESVLDLLHEFALKVDDTDVGVAAVFAAARFNLECIVKVYQGNVVQLKADKQQNIKVLMKSFRRYLDGDYDDAVKQLQERYIEN